MITGDNVLTACHVARSLHLTKKTLLALTKCTSDDADLEKWIWQSTDKSTHFDLYPKDMNQFLNEYDLALTGEVCFLFFCLFLGVH